MSVGHPNHVLIVYSWMEHVTWKSPRPMCGWVGILHHDSCTSVSSWSKVPLLSIWSVSVPLCRPLLPCASQWHGSLPRHGLWDMSIGDLYVTTRPISRMKFVLIFLTFQCSHSYTVSKHFDENLRWGFLPVGHYYRNNVSKRYRYSENKVWSITGAARSSLVL